MDTARIIELLSYTIPALITGGIAYYFFQAFISNEDKKRQFLLRRANQKKALPLRLQAYERMALFLERINPTKLMIRVVPVSETKNDYENYLIAHIEQEFEHNLTQQIYLTDECWTIITAAKNTTIQLIRNAAKNEKTTDANALRELVLNDLMAKQSPSNTALAYLKNEVAQIL